MLAKCIYCGHIQNAAGNWMCCEKCGGLQISRPVVVVEKPAQPKQYGHNAKIITIDEGIQGATEQED